VRGREGGREGRREGGREGRCVPRAVGAKRKGKKSIIEKVMKVRGMHPPTHTQRETHTQTHSIYSGGRELGGQAGMCQPTTQRERRGKKERQGD
jgi:hypothetical protein